MSPPPLGEHVLLPVDLAALPQPPRAIDRRRGRHGVAGEGALVDPHFVAVVVSQPLNLMPLPVRPSVRPSQTNTHSPRLLPWSLHSPALIHSLDANGALAVLGGALLAEEDAVERVSGRRPMVDRGK